MVTTKATSVMPAVEALPITDGLHCQRKLFVRIEDATTNLSWQDIPFVLF